MSNGRMTRRDQRERMWKISAVGHVTVTPQHLPGMNAENRSAFRSGYFLNGPKTGNGTSLKSYERSDITLCPSGFFTMHLDGINSIDFLVVKGHSTTLSVRQRTVVQR